MERIMLFILLGLVAAMLFGMFYGSEAELPSHIQDGVFWALIGAGVVLQVLQIAYESLCRHCHCRICFAR